MAGNVSPVPSGFHTITPSLVVRDPDAAITMYEQAFGAEQTLCLRTPEGQVMHAELKIGDSIFMLGGEWPEMGVKAPAPDHCSGSLHLYVADVDKAFERAVRAGCQPIMPPADMFWGDRYAKVLDPFGHQWSLGTRLEDLSPQEMVRRAAAWKPS